MNTAIIKELKKAKYQGMETNQLPTKVAQATELDCERVIYEALYQVDIFNLDFDEWMRGEVVAVLKSA